MRVINMINNGIDIVQISRFDKLKNNNTFMHNIFNDKELEYIKQRNNNSSTISGLYAAKEAFLKAIKKGINDYALKDIEISHNDNNAPYIILHNELDKLYNSNNISLSISHDGDYCIAIASYLA